MRYVLGVLICLIIEAFVCPNPGVGNEAPLVPHSQGGAAAPKAPHATIRMDSEQVIIRLERSTYTVDAAFHFFNTGETTTEWVGFPKRGRETIMSEAGHPVKAEFVRFDTWVDGTKIGVEEEIEAEEVHWLARRITFPGHTGTTIRTSYEAEYSYSFDHLHAYYIFGTGALWKDNIGKAVFVVDSSDIGGTNKIKINVPGASRPRRIGDNLVRFEIENAKPGPKDTLTIEMPTHVTFWRDNAASSRTKP